jgi:acyl carrier protein
METKIAQSDLINILNFIFDIQEELNESSDLSLYIKDSIDLGELLAVIKNKYTIEPKNKELFRKYKNLGDVLKVINNEIAD